MQALGSYMKIYQKFIVFASTFLTCLNIQAQSIPGWVDVTINTNGEAEKVTLISPSLSPEMSKPIEDAIKQWEFEPGKRGGELVKRTTSVAILISLINSGEKSQITATKIKEGPRILKKADANCLKELRKRGLTRNIILKYTVSPDGSVENLKIKESNATEELENCIVSITKKTIFKPETFDGVAVASELERQFSIK
jgi:TonB family protein